MNRFFVFTLEFKNLIKNILKVLNLKNVNRLNEFRAKGEKI